jgi:hypothetical protein
MCSYRSIETLTLLATFLIFSTCGIANANDPTLSPAFYIDECRHSYPVWFAEIDAIAASQKTEFDPQRAGRMAILRLPYLTKCLEMDHLMLRQGNLNIGDSAGRVQLDKVVVNLNMTLYLRIHGAAIAPPQGGTPATQQ